MRYILLFIAFLSFPFLYHRVTHKFRIPPSHPQIAYNVEWEVPSEEEKVIQILSGPLTYLDSGNQCHVFKSEDDQYVVKIFRFKYPRFEATQHFRKLGQRLLGRRVKDDFSLKVQKTFKAACIAATAAKDQTQVIYSHLNLTKNKLPTSHFKTPSKSFCLPMDRSRFVIQKKALPFEQKMLAAREDPQRMYALIDSYIGLIQSRISKAIRNADPKLESNFGFIGSRAVEIDFGNYRQLDHGSTILQKEKMARKGAFRQWLRKKAPDYIPYFDRIQDD